MEMKFCQSCGMPLQAEDQWGTNADGSLNEEYCCYCYQKDAFTQDYTCLLYTSTLPTQRE